MTTVEDALDAAAAGADAVGLNFYGGSKRCVDASTAERICISMPADVKTVGVFVNAGAAEIAAITEQVELNAVQLHGDEPPEYLGRLPHGVAIVRAYRCGEQGLAPLRAFLAECRSHGRIPDAVLIDADVAEAFGGTGRAADWALLARDRHLVGEIPFILAGGLTPGNVGAAIAAVRPDGVDVASGVEREPGRKDAALVQQFVAAAGAAFAAL